MYVLWRATSSSKSSGHIHVAFEMSENSDITLSVHVSLGNILFITGKRTGFIKHQQIRIAYQEQSIGSIIGFTDSDRTADKPFLVSSP